MQVDEAIKRVRGEADFEAAEFLWKTGERCMSSLKVFKNELRKRAGGKFARFEGVNGVWLVSPQKRGKARVTFVAR